LSEFRIDQRSSGANNAIFPASTAVPFCPNIEGIEEFREIERVDGKDRNAVENCHPFWSIAE
jgi:hypothetical protein